MERSAYALSEKKKIVYEYTMWATVGRNDIHLLITNVTPSAKAIMMTTLQIMLSLGTLGFTLFFYFARHTRVFMRVVLSHTLSLDSRNCFAFRLRTFCNHNNIFSRLIHSLNQGDEAIVLQP